MITFVKILLAIIGLSLLTTIILGVMKINYWWVALIVFFVFLIWFIFIAVYNTEAFAYTEIGNKMVDAYENY